MNGTHELTFEMPEKYFDYKTGDFIHNEVIDSVFNESHLKLYYKDDWYEFFVKNVDESKNGKTFVKKFTCSDAHIDELSRNGYGITFSTDLYNNVNEMGVFTKEILKDSAWSYAPEYNWGDFTEYIEEKLFKIPVSMFYNIEGFKLNYSVPYGSNNTIKNIYTGETRPLEMGDDAAQGYFWDQ
jgi:hypothetical protein